MRPFEALFTFKGRMTRSDYWLKGILPLLPVWFIINVLLYVVNTGTSRDDALFLIIVTIWPILALSVKRLHDRNRSGWLILFAVIPIIGQLWFLAEIWLLRGTIGPNRFGDDPCKTQTSATQHNTNTASSEEGTHHPQMSA